LGLMVRSGFGARDHKPRDALPGALSRNSLARRAGLPRCGAVCDSALVRQYRLRSTPGNVIMIP